MMLRGATSHSEHDEFRNRVCMSSCRNAVVHFCNSSSVIIYITITVMYYHITNKPFFTCDKVNILPVFYFSSVITTKIVDIFEKKFFPQSGKVFRNHSKYYSRCDSSFKDEPTLRSHT